MKKGQKANINPEEKGLWRLGRARNCLASHACVPGLNLSRFFREISLSCLSLLICLGDHVDGCLIELRLKTVYRINTKPH